jgi:hypothetical protein
LQKENAATNAGLKLDRTTDKNNVSNGTKESWKHVRNSLPIAQPQPIVTKGGRGANGPPKTKNQLASAMNQLSNLSQRWERPTKVQNQVQHQLGKPVRGSRLSASARKKKKRDNKRARKLKKAWVQQEEKQLLLHLQQHQEKLQQQQAPMPQQQHFPLVSTLYKDDYSPSNIDDYIKNANARKRRKWDDVKDGSSRTIDMTKKNDNLEVNASHTSHFTPTSKANSILHHRYPLRSRTAAEVQEFLQKENVRNDEIISIPDESEEMDISDDDDDEGNDSLQIVNSPTVIDLTDDGKGDSAPMVSTVIKNNPIAAGLEARLDASEKQISCHEMKVPNESKSKCHTSISSKSSIEGSISHTIDQQRKDVVDSAATQQNEESLAQKRLRLAKALKKVEIEKAKAKLRMAKIKKKEALESKLMQEKYLSNSNSYTAKGRAPRSTSNSPKPTDASSLPKKLPDITAFKMKELIISGINDSGPVSKVRMRRKDYIPTPPVSSKPNPVRSSEGEVQTGTTRTVPQINLELQRKKLRLQALKAQALQKAELRKNTSELTNINEEYIPEKGVETSHDFDLALNVEYEEGVDSPLEGSPDIISESNLENEETIDSLRKRQMVLKESIVNSRETNQELRYDNEVADLRVMIEKQQKILKEHGEKLRVGRIAMKKCTEQLHSEKEEVSRSQERVMDLLKKKEMMQNMVKSVSKQVMDARRKRNMFKQDMKERAL